MAGEVDGTGQTDGTVRRVREAHRYRSFRLRCVGSASVADLAACVFAFVPDWSSSWTTGQSPGQIQTCVHRHPSSKRVRRGVRAERGCQPNRDRERNGESERSGLKTSTRRPRPDSLFGRAHGLREQHRGRATPHPPGRRARPTGGSRGPHQIAQVGTRYARGAHNRLPGPSWFSPAHW